MELEELLSTSIPYPGPLGKDGAFLELKLLLANFVEDGLRIT